MQTVESSCSCIYMAVIPEILVFSFVTGTCHSPAVPLYEVRKQYMYLHQIRVEWSIIETNVEKPFVAKRGHLTISKPCAGRKPVFNSKSLIIEGTFILSGD